MRRTTAVVALGVLLATSAFTAHADDALKKLRRAGSEVAQADKALRSGDVAKARERFAAALAQVPNFPPAHMGLGHIATMERNLDAALREYKAAHDGYLELGQLMFDVEVDRYRRAQDDIIALQDRLTSVRSPSQKLDEAQVRDQTRSIEDAIQKLRAIAPPDQSKMVEPPGDVDFFLGNVLFSLNRREEAVAAWETARSKGVRTGMLMNNLAVGLWKVGRLEDARRALVEAETLGVKINPAFRADLEKSLAEAGIATAPK